MRAAHDDALDESLHGVQGVVPGAGGELLQVARLHRLAGGGARREVAGKSEQEMWRRGRWGWEWGERGPISGALALRSSRSSFRPALALCSAATCAGEAGTGGAAFSPARAPPLQPRAARLLPQLRHLRLERLDVLRRPDRLRPVLLRPPEDLRRAKARGRGRCRDCGGGEKKMIERRVVAGGCSCGGKGARIMRPRLALDALLGARGVPGRPEEGTRVERQLSAGGRPRRGGGPGPPRGDAARGQAAERGRGRRMRALRRARSVGPGPENATAPRLLRRRQRAPLQILYSPAPPRACGGARGGTGRCGRGTPSS